MHTVFCMLIFNFAKKNRGDGIEREKEREIERERKCKNTEKDEKD